MKLVFLDIDGVLNSAEYMRERRHLQRPSPHSIDAAAVPRLNALTDRTGARIVVSSTWRLTRTVARLAEVLALHGVTGEVVAKTPRLIDHDALGPGRHRAAERGREIQRWLDEHNASSVVRVDDHDIVILDDNSDMAHLKHRLVLTTWERGLQDHHVEYACALLGGPR